MHFSTLIFFQGDFYLKQVQHFLPLTVTWVRLTLMQLATKPVLFDCVVELTTRPEVRMRTSAYYITLVPMQPL